MASSPDNWDPDPEGGEPKITVDEIWCSPYGANPHHTTDGSQPLVDEVRRREKLQGTAEGERAEIAFRS